MVQFLEMVECALEPGERVACKGPFGERCEGQGKPLEWGLTISQGFGLAGQGSKTGHRGEYGKPSAWKQACSVWMQGKT